jgi:hypothetical protein
LSLPFISYQKIDELWKKIKFHLDDFKDSVQQPLFEQTRLNFENFHDKLADGFIQESYDNVDDQQKRLNSPIITNLLKTVTKKLEDENGLCLISMEKIFIRYFDKMKSGVLDAISLHIEDLKDPIKNYVRSNKYPPSDVDWGDLRSFSSNQNCISFASTSDL